jgi:hypothetical protein
VNSLGLQTQVHPAAMHGAIFQLNKYLDLNRFSFKKNSRFVFFLIERTYKGRFQGTMRQATPAAMDFN